MNVPASTDSKGRLHQHLMSYNLAEDLVEELVDHTMLVNYGPGATVFLQGSSADLLVWLVRGTAKVYCPLVDGTRVLARLAGPGDLMGQADFLNANGRRRQLFEVQAASRCEVALLTREHILNLLQRLEKADMVRLLEVVNSTWAEVVFWYITLLGLDFRRRFETVLRDLATRFGIKEQRGVLITADLSQLDLAEMIGSSKPMISRLVKEMSATGELIRVAKQYIIGGSAAWLAQDALLPQIATRNGSKRASVSHLRRV